MAPGSGLNTGIGLRAQHHEEILSALPSVGWFEAHSENYFAPGGAHRGHLTQIRAHYELSLHGVGLSIGSTDRLDLQHLRELKRLINDVEPMFVSEHLSWGSSQGRYLNDLLPLPHTEEALQHMAMRVREVQDFLGRQILIENISSYLRFKCSEVPEWEFLAALAAESGCGVLLDVNNVYVNAMNHRFSPHSYLHGIPRTVVKEFHLGGHTLAHIGQREIRIDTHNTPVSEDVWALYATAVKRFGPVPTLIEWDADIPSLVTLQAEAARADWILEALRAIPA
jgi:uncharacterized protein